VGEGSIIKDSIIMQNCIIDSNVTIKKSIVDEDVIIEKGCKIGGDEEITVIGTQSLIKADNIVNTGDRINPLSVYSR